MKKIATIFACITILGCNSKESVNPQNPTTQSNVNLSRKARSIPELTSFNNWKNSINLLSTLQKTVFRTLVNTSATDPAQSSKYFQTSNNNFVKLSSPNFNTESLDGKLKVGLHLITSTNGAPIKYYTPTTNGNCFNIPVGTTGLTPGTYYIKYNVDIKKILDANYPERYYSLGLFADKLGSFGATMDIPYGLFTIGVATVLTAMLPNDLSTKYVPIQGKPYLNEYIKLQIISSVITSNSINIKYKIFHLGVMEETFDSPRSIPTSIINSPNWIEYKTFSKPNGLTYNLM
ncbi:MAG: hypothetical protein CFE22_18065 [Cytophagaceae bacterium BCCC1]|nr:MAG: hypothetical protein CFE22_18065 [Cytophagaceae bacterium BCCC1]